MPTTPNTPGPWTIEGPFGPVKDQGDMEIVGGSGATVAQIPRGHAERFSERRADARLIAAAPKMQTALRNLEALVWRWRETGMPPNWNEWTNADDEARALLAGLEGV